MNKNTIVEQIHREVDEAQEQILKEAKEIIKKNEDDEYYHLLKQTGFTSVEGYIEKVNQLERFTEAQRIVRIIEDHNKHYSDLKFLTEEKFKMICEKYNLICAPVSNYKKDVPLKNLKEIANAPNLLLDDRPKDVLKYTFSFYDDVPKKLRKELEELETTELIYDENTFISMFPKYKIKKSSLYRSKNVITINRQGLFIAAPESHFNLNGLKGRNSKFEFFNFKLIPAPEPKDPIVFRYTKYGIQILSKWGEEASDPELQ